MPSTHTTPISPGKWLQTQRLVHMGLVLGLGASIVVLNMDNIPEVDFQSLDYLFPYGVPVLAVVLLLYIVTLAPTRQRVLNDLQLNPEQRRAFEADFKK